MTEQTEELGKLASFYRLIQEVTARLVGAQAAEIDVAIDDCLAKLGEHFCVSQVGLGQWSKAGKILPSLRAWGDRPATDYLTAVGPGPEAFAYFCGRGYLIWNCLEDLEDLPQFREHARQVGAMAGAFSLHRNFGSHTQQLAMAKENPEAWPEDTIECLSAVGGVLFNALYRREAEVRAAQAYDEIRTLKDHLKAENITLREEIETSLIDDELIGKSHAFQTILRQAKQVASTDSTVLILGETGTGKGLIARRIHQQSGRKDQPMVTVNCAALPEALIESELFGHEKGAFTGAIARKIGRFELADGGTIFLDEIGDLPLELQAKLLRVLQEHEFERLGSSNTKTVDTRVIAATNRDLDMLITEAAFRRDLYYRLSVFPIRIPPLRERRDDIPVLVWYFIANLQTRLGKTIDTVPTRVMNALISHDWPGNVRELQNILERAMILSAGRVLELENVLPASRAGRAASAQTPERRAAGLEEFERAHIISVLEECDWRVRGKDGAAELLRLKRSTLQSRMKKLGIQRPAV